MVDLLSLHTHICVTAVGFLIYQNKVLLVKHKKLGIWLAPGGHLEKDELPHKAAEREVFEETNVRVQAISALPKIDSSTSQFFPTPITINLHWISKTPLLPRGCQQHLGYGYLVAPLGEPQIQHDPAESDAIDWFTPDQIDALDTTQDVKSEIKLAFSLSQPNFNYHPVQ